MFPSTVSPERKMMPFGPLRANMSLHKWSEFSFMLIALAFEKSLANSLERYGVLLDPATWLQSTAALMASLSIPPDLSRESSGSFETPGHLFDTPHLEMK